MAHNTLTCKELVELVTEYFEGTLPAHERSRFEAHLSRCEGCANYLDQMRRAIQMAGQLTEESIKPEAQEALLQIFRDWKKG
jgi:anti-sigma factor RsiW